MTPEQQHLDLDELADVLVGVSDSAHVDGCPACRAGLAELRAADEQVRAQLGALPDPPLPAGLADRLDAALAALAAERPGSVTTLPAARPPRSANRWLPAAAAAVLLLGGGAFAFSQTRGGDTADTTSAGDSAAGAAETTSDLVRNDSGRAYDGRDALVAAVPELLVGSTTRVMAAPPAADAQAPAPAAAQAQVVDPLARLRTPEGLAECLLAVLPPDDPSVRPRALDYGTYKGQPAMVLLLPSPLPNKVDAYVLGPGCSRADAQVLFYTVADVA